MVNVNCTGGGGYFSDDVSATKAQVVKGKQTVTRDSNDEVIEGTMIEVGEAEAQKSNTVANSNLYLRMTNGAHRSKNQTSGYPEVYIPLQTLRSTIGATDASKILAGTNIAGLAGTMANQGAWNGTLGLSGQVTIPQGWHNGSGKIQRPYSTYAGGTFTPSVSNQTIPTAGKILTGDVKCKADANLVASNLKHGVSIMGITGTYFSPIIYDGGDGSGLFGSYFTGTSRQSGVVEEPGGGTAAFDPSGMYGWVKYDFATATQYQGFVCVLANKTFDISNFNYLTCTFSADSHPVYPGYYSIVCTVGLTQSNSHSGGVLNGRQFRSNSVYSYGGQKTVTLNLSTAKQIASNFYPYIEVGIGHDASYDATMNFRINSLVFS